MPIATPDEIARVLTLLERHGWNATSFQVLEEGFRYWFLDDELCVPYVDTGGAWVAAGAPLAAEDALARAAESFAAAARRAGRRACFFAAEERLVRALAWPAMLIGEQPVWAPGDWAQTLRASSSLREQLRRVRAKGITVRELRADEWREDTPVGRQIEALIRRWQSLKPMPPLGFLVHVDAFSHAQKRRLFAAERDGRVLGFLGAVPVFARSGWLFEDLVRDPDAPNGTNEALVDAAMRACAQDGARYVTLGLAPLSGAVSSWLRWAGRWGAGLFDFAGLRAFKAKLRPQSWDAIYICHPADQNGASAVYDVLKAFARGRLLSFGIETLLRGPAVFIRLLAALLVPWTLLLAQPGAARFFPTPAIRFAWVGVDVGRVVALGFLIGRWRNWLARGLSLAIKADAILTIGQAAAFNLWRVRTGADVLFLAAGIGGTTVAALVLDRAWRRHRVA